MSILQLAKQYDSEALASVPLVDIVAVHGLYEGALETWTDPKSSVLWLRDLFPHEKFGARILAFSYKAESLTSTGQDASDPLFSLATNLIAELFADRQVANAENRPIIFICHGFGGILVKLALAHSSTSRSKHVEHLRSIYISTYAILFMGTPHTGMSKDAILFSQDDCEGQSMFMVSLLKGSEMLQGVTARFAPIMKQFCVYYFWEQMTTQVGNAKVYIAEKDSAAPAWDNVDRYGIMATHSGMVKFTSGVDRGYQVVCEALVRYIKAAPSYIKSRWRNDQKLLAEERQIEAEALLQSPSPYSPFDDSSPTDINEYYLVPRCSCNYFTGRKVQSKVLKDKFGPIQRRSKRGEHKVFVVYGLGGSGKTQFCLRYAEENAPSYWGIFWIDASSEENAESCFADLGQKAGKGATFAAGMHWLSTCSKPWLLIVDNADDPDMEISKYFPPGGKGHILITTRNPGAVIHATIGDFHFRGMDPDEAITLLLKSAHQPNKPVRCDDESKKFASGIACELGYLALALTHAGATIRRNIYTLEKYLHYYLGYRKGMMGYSHIKNPDDASIITTWEIPFRRIATRESVEYRDAADLMHIFAFMHFESIPESIFEKYWSAVEGTEPKLTNYPDILQNKSAWSEETHARLRRALNILCDYSIIDHDPDKGLCSLHPVIHSWARGRLTLLDQKRWLSYTSTVLACCISPNLEASGRAFRRLLLPHIDSCLRALHSLYQLFPENVEQATEVDKFASVYAENGLWKLAREWQHKVIELRTRKLGKRHKDTIQAQVSLGYIYWNKFEIKSAIEVQNQVRISQWWSRPSLACWTTCPPWKPDHISYSMALSDLTQSLWLAGRRGLSKMTGERAVHGLIKHLGPDDPITLSAMFNLARTYLHLDEYKKCHELLILVVKKRKRFFGPNHVDTLMARNELGMSYRAQGRMDIAERIVTNVVESRKRILGEEHAYTLWSVNDLSKILCDRGRPENAVSMLEDIIPVVIRTLGEEHVGLVMTQSNLARAYSLCERRDEALVLLRKLTAVIPSNHPDWIHAMSGSVHVRLKLGQLEEIEKDCNKMLDIIINTKVLTLDNPRTLAVAEQLLRIYRDQGRSDDILSLKKRVPGINENSDAQKGLLAMLYGTYVRSGKARLINTFL